MGNAYISIISPYLITELPVFAGHFARLMRFTLSLKTVIHIGVIEND